MIQNPKITAKEHHKTAGHRMTRRFLERELSVLFEMDYFIPLSRLLFPTETSIYRITVQFVPKLSTLGFALSGSVIEPNSMNLPRGCFAHWCRYRASTLSVRVQSLQAAFFFIFQTRIYFQFF